MIARIYTPAGLDVSHAMVADGYATEYRNARRRRPLRAAARPA